MFMAEHKGKLRQMVRLGWPAGFPGEFTLTASMNGDEVESRLTVDENDMVVPAFVPTCEESSCRLELEARDSSGILIAAGRFTITAPRKWNVYIAPFSHIDIGFTQTQANVLAKNIDNLRAALSLIERSGEHPEEARLRFFTEVSWAAYEFLYTDRTSHHEKSSLLDAFGSGRMELGAFYISHENKFMPSEAMFRSLDFALRINRDFGVPVRTGCIHDLSDLSHAVKPLYGAGVRYFMGGPNDSRYVVPPLFYLKPPVGDEEILVWHTPGLNGYGENFDLAMRPDLPISEQAMAEMERRLGGHLKELESGFPTETMLAHYDYFGAHWDYPFDIYFLPFYPAHEVDNGPQDLTPCEIARLWNERWAYPKLKLVTPSEFFTEIESRYSDRIPVIRGELPGFWGEQVMFDLIQVDPEKEALQREFERNALLAEMLAAERYLRGLDVPDISGMIREGYSRIILNNDHNPGPVPFGNTEYTKDDVEEWKHTRRKWIKEADELGKEALRLASMKYSGSKNSTNEDEAGVVEVDEGFILENRFYRVMVDKDSGGIKSIIDKELNKELVRSSDGYLFNQYVVLSRGESIGLRGCTRDQAGFRNVKADIIAGGPERAAVMVTGESSRFRGQGDNIARFAREKFGISLPGWLIKGIASAIFKLGKGEPLRVEQEIALSAGIRRVDFIQRFSGEEKQIIDHAFACPFNIEDSSPIHYDGAYEFLSFTAGPPLGRGDMIPSAKFLDDYPSINFSTAPFHWIYGMPASLTFRNYATLMGDGFAVTFSSPDSGALLPGPLHHDPGKGPFGGAFYHLCVGWTAWGKLGLGIPDKEEHEFRSFLTSFAAENLVEARKKSAQFALGVKRAEFSFSGVSSDNPQVAVTAAWPLPQEKALIIRLWEVSGNKAEAGVTLKTERRIAGAARARSDGVAFSGAELDHSGQAFRIRMLLGEVATVRVELK